MPSQTVKPSPPAKRDHIPSIIGIKPVSPGQLRTFRMVQAVYVDLKGNISQKLFLTMSRAILDAKNLVHCLDAQYLTRSDITYIYDTAIREGLIDVEVFDGSVINSMEGIVEINHIAMKRFYETHVQIMPDIMEAYRTYRLNMLRGTRYVQIEVNKLIDDNKQ